MSSKNISIVLPNSTVFQTSIEEDSAFLIYEKIERYQPGLTRDTIKIKKDLTEDEINSGEKYYDFGKIKDGQRILTFIIEPKYEILDYVLPLTKCGSDFWGPEYTHAVRYHFKIANPIYQTFKSLSIIHDLDINKFALEPSFHRGNYSKVNDFKPFLTTTPFKNYNHADNPRYSLSLNVQWYNQLSDLLHNLPNEEGDGSLSNNSISNIVELYEKHKIIPQMI
jgi:hypothetical protein